MLWTLLSALLVLGIRLFTVYRLRGLKRQLAVNKPKLEKMHVDTAKHQAEVKSVKLEETHLQSRLNHIKDIVHNMEVNLRKPLKSDEKNERAQILETEEAL
jgi:hypothetical protein